MDTEGFSRKHIETLCGVLRNLPLGAWTRALQLLERAYVERRQVFLIGNGGSAATASHMANDLMLGVAKGGARGFRAIALTGDVSVITATANDVGFEHIFAVQLRALGRRDDVLIAISGSGNSPNLVEATRVARQLEMVTIGFLGMGGGQLAPLVDVAVVVPSDDYGAIEDVHLVLDHVMTAYFRRWGEAG